MTHGLTLADRIGVPVDTVKYKDVGGVYFYDVDYIEIGHRASEETLFHEISHATMALHRTGRGAEYGRIRFFERKKKIIEELTAWEVTGRLSDYYGVGHTRHRLLVPAWLKTETYKRHEDEILETALENAGEAWNYLQDYL